jgi:ATP-binding cassette subfamily B (MDR/TAP) protein 6
MLRNVHISLVLDTDNLMKLLAEPKEIEDRPNAQTIIKAKGTIEFDHVGFSYDGKSSALEDISFTVPAGSSVALVGESGSGKSTILRLLFRFYDPTVGSIKLDGVDIRDLTQASYRSQIGSVPQDAALFNDTIR